MAMGKKVGSPFGNEEQVIRVRWSFDADGGDVGALDIIEAQKPILITGFAVRVKQAVTSTGNLTLAVGPTGALTKFLTATQGAKANLTLGAALFPLETSTENATSWVPTLPHLLTAGQKIVQTIGTEDADAGEVEYIIKYVAA